MKGRERNSRFFQEATNKQKSNKSFVRTARETGQVNLSNRNISEFPIEILSIDETLEADENFWEMNPITKVDLCHNTIPSVPDEIWKLSEFLQTLRMRDNRIQMIPDSLYQCTALRSLDLANNKIQVLSHLVAGLSVLKELFLFGNMLSHVPESLCECSMIQTLDLQDNRISQLPDNFSFGAILRLNLSGNSLDKLPSTIAEFHSLSFLDVKRNNLRTLPDLGYLDKLTFLDASENRLEIFPALPENSSCLDRLLLGNNKLTVIELSSLLRTRGCLSELIINDNLLTEIPADIGLMSACKILNFSNNNLSDLPPSIGIPYTL